jgi:hypothetical protein
MMAKLSIQKYGNVLLCLVILAGAAVGAFRGIDALQSSLFTYQSPLSAVQVVPGEQMPRQVEHVVIVVIGGLGYADGGLTGMPNLEMLMDAGAISSMVSNAPTYPLPAWTTLITGLWPELNNAPITDPGKVAQRPVYFDHIFAAAHDAGLRTAIAGSEGWRSLLPSDTVDASYYSSGEDALADAQVVQAAFGFIADPQYNLILIHFSQVDAVGQSEGTIDPGYQSAARQIDAYLRQIMRLVDPANSVLIVTADHGLMEDGGLGGDEPELTRLPLVMVGEHIVPGVYSPVDQVDIAPTIAALLGTRLPATAQGRPLYEMMRLDEDTLTQGYLVLATQKVALSDAYRRIMGETGLNQMSQQDLLSAEQSLQAGNRAGAHELAKLVAEEATEEMARAKSARIAQGKLPRLGAVAFGLLVSLIFFWGRRRPTSLLSFIGAGVTLATYYALYWLKGYAFSPSTISQIDVFVFTLARNAVIAFSAGALWILLGLFYRDERRWPAALMAGYDFGLFAVFLAVLPASFVYWQQGATVRWYLPDLGLTLLYFLALLQAGVVAFLSISFPWLVGLVAWGVGRWRSYAESRVEVWDPITRLRRR